MSSGEPRWVADTSIGWRILLTATLPSAPSVVELGASLRTLYDEQGWPSPPEIAAAPDVAVLRRELTEGTPAPLVLGLAGTELVVSAHHAAVDGLGLLEVVDRCGYGPVSSSARGIGSRPAGGGLLRSAGARLGEALARPPARPVSIGARAASGAGASGDAMCELDLPARVRTADLVHAAAGGVADWQRAHGARTRHVAIAVGAGRVRRPAGAPLADDSALLRLRDVERLDRDGIDRAVREAVPEASPHGAGSALGRVMGVGMRLLAPRLGSTLLVSHLGDVTAPVVRRMAFHPVTAGGSGLSLGAVRLDGTTTLTLRARAAQWNDDGLEQLLEAIVARI